MEELIRRDELTDAVTAVIHTEGMEYFEYAMEYLEENYPEAVEEYYNGTYDGYRDNYYLSQAEDECYAKLI